MQTEKRFNRAVALSLAAALLLSSLLLAMPGSKAYAMEYESLFDTQSVMQVDVQVDEEKWEAFLQEAENEEYIEVDLAVNGTVYSSVGLRAKGNSSLSRASQSGRYSFKIDFGRYVSGQTLKGLDRLVLNNCASSYLTEYLSYYTMERAGVATPLYCYAWITINGQPWGLYLALEVMEQSYLLRTRGGEYGLLYKPETYEMGGGSVQEETENATTRFLKNALSQSEEETEGTDADSQQAFLEQLENMGGDFGDVAKRMREGSMPRFGGGFGGSGGNLAYIDDDIDSYDTIFDSVKVGSLTKADKKRLIQALKTISEGGDLESAMDTDAMLRYMASNVMLLNDDSYFGTMAHNYYIYEENGRLTMLPWDYDYAFGGFSGGDAQSLVNRPIDDVVYGVELSDRPLLNALISNETYKEIYHQYLREIAADWQDGTTTAELERVCALIAEYVQADPNSSISYEDHTAESESLALLIKKRGESVLGQLDGSIPSTSEGQAEQPDALVDAEGITVSSGMQNPGGDMPQGGMQPPNGQAPGGDMPQGGMQPPNGQSPGENMPQGGMQPPDGEILGDNMSQKEEQTPTEQLQEEAQPGEEGQTKTGEEGQASAEGRQTPGGGQFPGGNGGMPGGFSPDAADGNDDSEARVIALEVGASFALLLLALVFVGLYGRKR